MMTLPLILWGLVPTLTAVVLAVICYRNAEAC